VRLTQTSKTGVPDWTDHAGRAQFTAEPDVCRATANHRNRRITDWQSSPSTSQDADGAGAVKLWAITARQSRKEHRWRHDSPDLRTFMGAVEIHSNLCADLASA
jgi:hypothetical protein